MAKDPLTVTDIVHAELVDCMPESEPDAPKPSVPEQDSPISAARDATLGHTGADPPPDHPQPAEPSSTRQEPA